VSTPKRPEALEQSRIVKLLKSLGFRVWPTSQVRQSRVAPGLPDLFATHRSRKIFVSIEVKALGGRISDEQLDWADDCRAAKVPAIIGTYTDVCEWLTHRGIIT